MTVGIFTSMTKIDTLCAIMDRIIDPRISWNQIKSFIYNELLKEMRDKKMLDDLLETCYKQYVRKTYDYNVKEVNIRGHKRR